MAEDQRWAVVVLMSHSRPARWRGPPVSRGTGPILAQNTPAGRPSQPRQSRRPGNKKPRVAGLFFYWSGKRDSNSRPQPWQGCALPTELFPHVFLQRVTIARDVEWRPGSESNRRTRICNPLHNHSATRPNSLQADQKNLLTIKKPHQGFFGILERETRLELATSTLARLRSTN